MSLKSLLGIELPIIQAPMAGAQNHTLAAAVCEAGGLGSIPAGMLDAAALEAELSALEALTDRPYNVNFFCHRTPAAEPARIDAWHRLLAPLLAEFDVDPASIPSGATRQPFDAAMAEVLERHRPAMISFHFGLPEAQLLQRARATGAKIVSSATTLAEGRWLQQHGVDAVIAQGLEAGGHRGIFLGEDLTTQVGTFALLPQLVAALDVPVIAAGGIADAHGVAAAQALGAAGVQLGTAYLLCPESRANPFHRAALKSPQAAHTALTTLFSGRPARGIVNRIMRELGPLPDGVPPFPLAGNAIGALRAKTESRGLDHCTPLWAGQNVSGCREIPAAALTRELAAGWRG
ncbi:2-nitropropane dioxygenase [Stutzerimonas stutzeri]|uniref:Nitronate monooxygenase n=1 Tax=Stutzerimonas stutzeri TaxID=316 RepID=A0A2N8T3Z3_STUST|nr:nitronate monooxygenase [Stutzerimonas stutzeri]MCQ4325380.1 nitronate monooxygenase [Stutzerimonas stutzeri]PNG09471.1 2-nitropropane dioxygenase [Stutzerimonas stutzeri]